MSFVTSIMTAAALALAQFSPAFAAGPSPQDALNRIHHINQLEIHLAGIAIENTQNPQVLAFAHRMIKDHSSADYKTLQLAKTQRIELQSFEPTAAEKTAMARLQKLRGIKFDDAYMEQMKTGHEQALSFLKSTHGTTSDKGVKSLVSSLIPTIEHHESMATNIASNVREMQRQEAGQAGH